MDNERWTAPRVGALSVVIGGLAAGVPAAVAVTGPASVARPVAASTTNSDLPAGDYTVAAAAVYRIVGR